MRTTVTLDEDVASALARLTSERGITFKEAINSVLRVGLAPRRGKPSRYRMPASPMGLRAGVSIEHALRLAADLEDAEIVRKLELRK